MRLRRLPANITIRRIDSISDYKRCVEIEKRVWGYTKAHELVPASMLVAINRSGGLVLGAYDCGKLIGFVTSILGKLGKETIHWSHMLAVLPEHRNRDIGLALKLAQREHALKQRVKLIMWTFDPLQSLNAYFNLVKLGAISDRYETNVYGTSSSALHRGLATDRLVAKWHIASGRVKQRIGGKAPDRSDLLEAAPRINASMVTGDGLRRSTRLKLDCSGSSVLFEIPYDMQRVKEKDLSLARDWLRKARKAFLTYFGRGYVAADFIVWDDDEGKRACYVLTRWPLSFRSLASTARQTSPQEGA